MKLKIVAILSLLVLNAALGKTDDIQWSTLTSSELAEISPSAFETITTAQLASIPAQACSGFTSAQTSSILADSCLGFSKAQMQTLSVEGYSGLQASCVDKFDTTLKTKSPCSGITGVGLMSMADITVGHLSPDCVEQLPAASWRNATAKTMASLDPSSCTGLSWAISELSPAATSGISAECVEFFPTGSDGFCLFLDDKFIDSMNPSSCSGFRKGCLSEASLAFSSNHEASACVSNLNPKEIDQLFIATIDPTVFSFLQASQLANLSSSICLALSAEQVAMVQPTNFASLLHCVSGMRDTAVNAITPEQIAAVPPAMIKLLTRPDELATKTFEALNVEQARKFSHQALVYLSGKQYVSLLSKWAKELLVDAGGWEPSSFGIIFQDESVEAVKKAVAAGTIKAVVPAPTTCTKGFLAWPHLALMIGFPPQGWNAEFMRCMSRNAIAGFTPPQVAKITLNGMAEIDPELAYALEGDTFAAFTSEQWAALPAESFSNIQLSRWTGPASSNAFSLLNSEQISKIGWQDVPCAAVGGMTANQFTEVKFQSIIDRYEKRRAACGFEPLNISARTPSGHSNDGDGSLPIIIGGSVGGGVLLLVVIGVAVFVVRRRQASPENAPLLVNNR